MKKKLGENEIALPLISRERAELAVPLLDCSGRKYGKDEREDIIRYVILGAEIQRDTDLRMDTWDKRIKLNQKIEQWLGDFIILYYEEEDSLDIKKKLLKDRLLFRDFGVFVADRIEEEIQIEMLNKFLGESKSPLDDKLKTILGIKEEIKEVRNKNREK